MRLKKKSECYEHFYILLMYTFRFWFRIWFRFFLSKTTFEIWIIYAVQFNKLFMLHCQHIRLILS